MKDLLMKYPKDVATEVELALGDLAQVGFDLHDLEKLVLRQQNIGKPIELLNHGMLRLIDFMGSDLAIARNARVSYDAEWREDGGAGKNQDGDHGLIRYLKTNGHNTPFECCLVTFEVIAPIFVYRQWHRHRTQSYNELSARYKPLPDKWYVPELHVIGKQNADNKQMRDVITPEEFELLSPEEKREAKEIQGTINRQNSESYKTYQELLERGVPREIARSCTPVGMYSHMFATVNLHNLFGFLSERLHPHAQYEIRVYALAMLDVIKVLYPVATSAFIKTLNPEYGFKSWDDQAEEMIRQLAEMPENVGIDQNELEAMITGTFDGLIRNV